MSRKMVVTATLIAIGLSAVVWAQGSSALADENAQLKSRVDALEKQVQELASAAGTGDKASDKKSLWSSLDIQLYGYIKADAAWDNSSVTTGDYILYVDRGGENDSEFNLTARQTRLGLKFKGPDLGEIQTSGLVEGDFYGGGGTENKPTARMRHAYMKLLWPNAQFSILAGQTWDVVSPLYPDTLNFTILWDAGNIGYRHPQMRVTKEMQLDADSRLEVSGAISRTISEIEEAAGSGHPGAAAGFPTVQGRVGLTSPFVFFRPTSLGVSGHWGREDYPTDANRKSWSVNLDVQQPVNEWISVKGEAFVGENLDDYFGGIGQGVRIIRDENDTITAVPNGIASKGGWVQATLTPSKKWRFHLGAGVDDVDNSDVDNNGRTLNRAVYGNAIYALNKSADVGVELSHWRTDYKGSGTTEDVRLQTSLIYKF